MGLESYNFNLHSTLAISTASFTFLFNLYFIIKNRFNKESQVFFISSSMLVLWIFSNGMMTASITLEDAKFWNKIEHLGVILIPLTLFQFTAKALGIFTKFKRLNTIITIITIVLLILNFNFDSFFDEPYLYFFGFYPSYNLYSSSIIIFLIAVLIFNGIQYKKNFKYSNEVKINKKRSKLIYTGLVFIGTVGVTDFLPTYGFELYPIGYIGVLYLTIVTIVITNKYKFVYFIPEFTAEQILDSMKDGIIITDINGIIRKSNKTATEIFQKKSTSIYNYSFIKLIKDSSRNDTFKTLKKILDYNDKDFHLHKDKKHVIYKINVTTHLENNVETAYIISFLDVTQKRKAEREKEAAMSKLKKAFEEIKTLQGIVPICASCKKIRDDNGFWEQVEHYVSKHSHAQFSHSICPECTETLYPEYHSKLKE